MKTSSHTILSATFVCLYGFAILGCGESSPPAPVAQPIQTAEHDHEHGPNGMPVIKMSDGSLAEIYFDEEFSMFSITLPNPDVVTKVEIKTVVEGAENVYEMELEDSPGGKNWMLENKELGTAMLMGDAVERTLVVTTNDGEITGPVEHHVH